MSRIIEESEFYKVFYDENMDEYIVEYKTYEYTWDAFHTKVRTFKTESEALSFARTYKS
ncbi:MAG: hypothetical protein FWE58_00765 [Methanobrevibacter sp.]|nr:hypothetical protein [Methanobrevibacter sp.]